MSINYLKPFADWLSISYPTSQSPLHELLSYIGDFKSLVSTELGGGVTIYKSDSGTIKVTSKESYENISISGGVLVAVREGGDPLHFQQILSSAPYNITRLDVAYDVPINGHITIKSLQQRFPKSEIKVSNRNRKMQYVLSQYDGNYTGTCYLQNSKYKGTVLFRVYDKECEMFERHACKISPTTRYELSIKRGCSLRDVFAPDACFWHFCPSDLLRAPDGVPEWSAQERINYDDYLDSKPTDYQTLKWLIENSPTLNSLIEKANSVNGGRNIMLHYLESKLLDAIACRERSERKPNSPDHISH